MLCFFSAMLVTNDVALITFVPFTILLLQRVHLEEKLIPVIVLQTIAANLGSMLTPMGNPQNLYLYSLSGMGLGEFLRVMAPVAGLSLVLLGAAVLCLPKKPLDAANIHLNRPDRRGCAKCRGSTNVAPVSVIDQCRGSPQQCQHHHIYYGEYRHIFSGLCALAGSVLLVGDQACHRSNECAEPAEVCADDKCFVICCKSGKQKGGWHVADDLAGTDCNVCFPSGNDAFKEGLESWHALHISDEYEKSDKCAEQCVVHVKQSFS